MVSLILDFLLQVSITHPHPRALGGAVLTGQLQWARGSTGCAMQAGLATPASETAPAWMGQSGSRKARLAAGRDVWADIPTLAAWGEWPLHITNPSSFSPIVGYGGIWPGWDGKLLVSLPIRALGHRPIPPHER